MRRVEWSVFLWVALTGAYFIQGGSWNINARFDLTRSIVERGTCDCTAYAYNSGDLVERNGRLIPYKAPGISFLGVPFWAVLYWGSGGKMAATPHSLTVGAWLVTMGTTTLVVAWAAVWFFRFCLALRPGAASAAAWATAATFGGTMLLPTGTLLLGHATAAAFCWVAFVRALAVLPGTERGGLRIGVLLAGAVAVDYLALPVAAAIFLLALSRRAEGRWQGILLGALPVAAGLAAYQWALMGAPWRIPYSKPPAHFASQGALGGLFLTPSWRVIWQTTFGSYRGIFFGSPVLLAAFWGLARLWRREAPWRLAAAVSLFVVTVHLAFLWTFNGWHGGWTCGARYFVPALPFLAWPVALVVDRGRGATRGLAVISIALMLVATAVNPQMPDGNPARGLPDPWFDYLFPAFLAGDVADQAQSVEDRLPRYEYWPWGRELTKLTRATLADDNMAPKSRRGFERWRHAQDRLQDERFAEFPPGLYNPGHPDVAGATNWGMLLGLPGLLSLLPLGLIWLVLGLWFRRSVVGEG